MEKTCFSKGKTGFFTLICCFLRVKIACEAADSRVGGVTCGQAKDLWTIMLVALVPFEEGAFACFSKGAQCTLVP